MATLARSSILISRPKFPGSQFVPVAVAVCLLGLAASLFAAPYPLVFENTDSADIRLISAESEFRVIADVDGDARADAISLGDATGEQGASCSAWLVHRSSTLSPNTILSNDASNQIVIYNTGFHVDDAGCGPLGRFRVLGDVNGDGLADMAVVVMHDEGSPYPYEPAYLIAVIFSPDDSRRIDIGSLDGNNGFVVDNARQIATAGDVNGDGYADIILSSTDSLLVTGRSSYDPLYPDFYSLPDEMVLIKDLLGGGGLRGIGDVNGDGMSDILVGKINEYNQYAIVYGEPGLSRTLSNPGELSEQFLLGGCAVRFSCSISSASDFDDDGYDDLAVSYYGCGYAHEAAILYGSVEGIPRRNEISDYSGSELTRITDNISGGCLAGGLHGTAGDMDGDGSHDLFVSLNYSNSTNAAVVFGTPGERADFISINELDGSNGFLVSVDGFFEDIFGYFTDVRLAGVGPGIDVDADGKPDLLDHSESSEYDYDDLRYELSAGARIAVLGKDRMLDINGPRHVVVEQLPDGWQIRWSAPAAGSVAAEQYAVLLNGIRVANVDGGILDIQLTASDFSTAAVNDNETFQVKVQALSDTGAVTGATWRQVPGRVVGNNLTASVFGPSLVELVFNRQPEESARTLTYQLWRNGEFLTTPQENSSGYWDATVQPGQTYTYYLTPLYSRFNDVSSRQALRDRPVLQRRSNSVTITTPGGESPETGDPVDSGNGGEGPEETETITVNAGVIAWTAPGWHQVQSMEDYTSICEGGTECSVPAGRYVVINHDSGERISDIVVDAIDSARSVQVNGLTIEWPDDGWYQVQNATTYESICEGGRSCDVTAGTYIVINHSSAERWEDVQVASVETPGQIDVQGQTIYLPDDGWYQVQDASTYESLCEGVLTCEVPEGRYQVINHTSGERYEDVLVSSQDGEEPGDPGSGDVTSLVPTDIRLEIYGTTLAELFWEQPAGVLETEIYRDGQLIGTSSGTSFFDGTRSVGFPHHYELVSIDAAGNRSAPTGFGLDAFQIMVFDGYIGDSSELSLALSGGSAAVMVDQSFGNKGLSILGRSPEPSESEQWQVEHEFATEPYIWQSAIVMENETLLLATVRDDEELSDFENEIYFYDYDYFIFERDTSGVWNRQEIFDFSDSLMPNLQSGGASVALAGDTAILGGRNEAAYVFSRTVDGQWLETQKLTTSDGRPIGAGISMDGNTAVFKSLFWENGSYRQAAYLFDRDDTGQWSENQKIEFGESVDFGDIVISGNSLVASGFYDWGEGDYSTTLLIYTRGSDGQWVESQTITVRSYNPSIAIDGDTLAIGVPGANGLVWQSGAAYIYKKNATGIWEEYENLFPTTTGDTFGHSVALDGSTLMLNASSANESGATTTVYFYDF